VKITGHRGTGPLRVYLSGVASRTHAVYAASYLRALLATGPDHITVVDLGLRTFLGRANISSDDLARALPANERLSLVAPPATSRWDALPSEQLIYLAVGAPGIKPYLRLRRAHHTTGLHVVVVDEGLGSYGTWRSRRDAWRREGGREPWPTVRAVAVSWARRGLTGQRWPLYQRINGTWEVQDAVADEFRQKVSRRRTASRSVVFLSQPWVELGLLTEAAYLAHVDSMARSCAGEGLRLVVKPHPVEASARYGGFDVASSSGPAELDPDIVSAHAVAGLSSTALLNLAAVHGTPAVRLALPELASLEAGLSADQRSLLDRFLPAPRPPAALSQGMPRD
jgi:hypothetical protein